MISLYVTEENKKENIYIAQSKKTITPLYFEI